MESWSQFGEDRILAGMTQVDRILPHYDGRYVEVGGHKPIYHSNSLSLYLKGWSGVVVEANPKLAKAFQRSRKRDQVVCAVVSSEIKQAVFRLEGNELFSGIVDAPEGALNEGEVVLETRTLTNILEECGAPRTFDLLMIDCEGHDFDVLLGLDLESFRPKVVMIESHCSTVSSHYETSIHAYLENRGYFLRAFDVMNAYYVEKVKDES